MHVSFWMIIRTVLPNTVSGQGLRIEVSKLPGRKRKVKGFRDSKIKKSTLKPKHSACIMLLCNSYTYCLIKTVYRPSLDL